MDPRHGLGGGEREGSREHLVERDAVGVQIAARIDRAVHPAGLFRRHVGERAGHDVRRRGRRTLAWQAGRDAKAGQPRLARCGMREDMGRLDVLVANVHPWKWSNPLILKEKLKMCSDYM